MSGMMGTIAQGMAFGTGSAIAHRAVGAAAGAMSGGDDEVAAPQQIQGGLEQQLQQPQMGGSSCELDKSNFFDCLKANNGEADNCRFFMEAMKQCQAGGGGGGMNSMNSSTFN